VIRTSRWYASLAFFLLVSWIELGPSSLKTLAQIAAFTISAVKAFVNFPS
jgi:hypothetical protein